MLNRVILMGRLTADPELRQTGSGISVATAGSQSTAITRPKAATNVKRILSLASPGARLLNLSASSSARAA